MLFLHSPIRIGGVNVVKMLLVCFFFSKKKNYQNLNFKRIFEKKNKPDCKQFENTAYDENECRTRYNFCAASRGNCVNRVKNKIHTSIIIHFTTIFSM